jgi:hypothetical protein
LGTEVPIQDLSDDQVKEFIRKNVFSWFSEGLIEDANTIEEILEEIVCSLENERGIFNMIRNFRSLYGLLDVYVPKDPRETDESISVNTQVDDSRVEKNFSRFDVNRNDVSEGNSSLPIIQPEEVSNDVDMEIGDPYGVDEIERQGQEANDFQVIIQPSVRYLDSIVAFLRNVEQEKAQKQPIPYPTDRIDLAVDDVGKIAWEIDWCDDAFYARWARKVISSRESLFWNERMGFITPISSECLKFICSLLHQYFVVNYAYFTYEGEKIIESEFGCKNQIVEMFNDFCDLNNRPKLKIKECQHG